ncbi:MAG: hypothetical protein HRS50_01370 [Mycoplasmataceae bacterium]|nr:hypothetical protein [Mycoplasmataceae bacterium]
MTKREVLLDEFKKYGVNKIIPKFKDKGQLNITLFLCEKSKKIVFFSNLIKGESKYKNIKDLDRDPITTFFSSKKVWYEEVNKIIEKSNNLSSWKVRHYIKKTSEEMWKFSDNYILKEKWKNNNGNYGYGEYYFYKSN